VDGIDRANNLIKRYELLVFEQVVRVLQARTGRIVLDHIRRRSERSMTIIPYTDVSKSHVNANATPVAPHPLMTRGRRPGWDTEVRYSPNDWVPADPAFIAAIGLPQHWSGPGTDPDELLLHEMIHGLRQMCGRSNPSTVPNQPAYDTFEEFFAIVICNIYRSELKRVGLRSDHHGFKFLSHVQGVVTSEDFVKKEKNRAHLRQLRRDHRVMFNDLQTVTAAFNPTKLLL
jgi:hypothetical protein